MTLSYWNDYYEDVLSTSALNLPSQFGVFVAGELDDTIDTIVDFGCGTGRDSFMFLSQGYSVVGLDASESAIKDCKTHLEEKYRAASKRARFARHIVGSDSASTILDVGANARSIAVYARFFLHAIDEDGETAFFDTVRSLGKSIGLLALEFRTERDAPQAKITPEHYRRFIRPETVIEKGLLSGFRVEYFIEGFGLAKFRGDDAHVARLLFVP